LYLRIRPSNEKIVAARLASANIPYNSLGNNCIQLQNAASVDRLIDLDKEAVVQDYNSQRVAELFSLPVMNKIKSVWDCCAASGGKSLLLHDVHPAVILTVSDKRESIIANLKKRFARAGITRYKALVTDLSSEEHALSKSKFDLIIADVPCTGSGTWSRTPEQLYYFKKEKIVEYAALQRKLVSNAIPSLKQDGFLLYITCSVFKKENEENIAFIQKQFGLKLIKMELFKGYDRRADTLLAALLQVAS
jgi:16S rRNA (cytosine967-C5)-methyltransferase